jgi:hypothetical protein
MNVQGKRAPAAMHAIPANSNFQVLVYLDLFAARCLFDFMYFPNRCRKKGTLLRDAGQRWACRFRCTETIHEVVLFPLSVRPVVFTFRPAF